MERKSAENEDDEDEGGETRTGTGRIGGRTH